MYHLRIVVPSQLADDVLDLLDDEPSACNLVHLPGAARGRRATSSSSTSRARRRRSS